MEETIGYEALFSPEEWESLEHWEPDPDCPHKVTVYTPGENKAKDDHYTVECDVCGHISAEDGLFEAEKLAVLHEILRARPVQARHLPRGDEPMTSVLLGPQHDESPGVTSQEHFPYIETRPGRLD